MRKEDEEDETDVEMELEAHEGEAEIDAEAGRDELDVERAWDGRMQKLFDALTAQAQQNEATSKMMADVAKHVKDHKGSDAKDTDSKERRETFELYGGKKEGALKIFSRYEEMGHTHFVSWMRIQEESWRAPTMGEAFQKELEEAKEEFQDAKLAIMHEDRKQEMEPG